MRITFEVDTSTHQILCKYIPHGLRKYAYKALFEGFVKGLQKDPEETLKALLEYKIDFKKLSRELAEDG